MRKQYFITSDNRLNPRWLQAFPDSSLIGMEKLGQQDNAAVIYWLNISACSADSRQQLLRDVMVSGRRIVVMTNEMDADEAMWVMQLGAVGYCHYLAAPEQLQEIASVVEHGGLWVGADLLQKLLAFDFGRQNAVVEIEGFDLLTAREKMVAEEAAKGVTNKEMALSLDVTERTIKAHMSVIFEKLQVRDRVQLALLLNKT